MEIKVNGIETPDGNINTFIPPSPTETERGGIKAKAKTNETVEVVVGSNGKLYVPTYPSIDKALTSSGSAADAKVVGDKLTEVNTEITALKKSVSDGKSKVASAITDKGVATEATDTFDVMAENIGKISGGGVSENMRTATFYDGNNIVAVNSAIINTYVQPPLTSEKQLYGVWKDNSGDMVDFPLKIINDIDLLKVGIIYDLSMGSLWRDGWSYSYDPERIYGDDYIMFSTNDDSANDRKNVIVTKNKYDLTAATLLHITLTTSNLMTSSNKPALVFMVTDNQTSEWGEKNLLTLSGANIVDGGYWLDVSELTGEHYIQVSCHHSSTKGNIKISQIYIS